MSSKNSSLYSSFKNTYDLLKMASSQYAKLEKKLLSLSLTDHLKDSITELKALSETLKGLHEQKLSEPQYNYCKLFKKSLQKICKDFAKLIKSDLKNWNSSEFRRYTFLFAHSAEELKYSLQLGSKFGKIDAGKWWFDNFGMSLVTEIETFFQRFASSYKGVFETDKRSLLKTLCFSSPYYVSQYDFDIFTRLFGCSSDELVTIWRRLVNHRGYELNGTYTSTNEALKPFCGKRGSYIFRLSLRSIGYWSIGYVNSEGKIAQIMVHGSTIMDALYNGKRSNLYIYPRGNECEDDFLDLCNRSMPYIISRSQGSGAMTCGVCKTNKSDTLMEPCCHLICKHCLKIQMGSRTLQSNLCFQCHAPILCTSSVTVQFEGQGNSTSWNQFRPEVYANNVVSNVNNVRPTEIIGCAYTSSSPMHPPSPAIVARSQSSASNSDTPSILQKATIMRAATTELEALVLSVVDASKLSRETVHTHFRVLADEGYSSRDIANALISSKGDRGQAATYLKENAKK